MNKRMDSVQQSLREYMPSDLKLTGFFPKTTLEVARATIKGMLGHALPKPVPDRADRLIQLVQEEVGHMPLLSLFPQVGAPSCRLSIDESFGKPLLVTVDLLFADPERVLVGLDEEEERALTVLAADLLDRVVRVLWDNPTIAPIAVRGRVLVTRAAGGIEESQKLSRNHLQLLPGEFLVVDMQGVGFTDDIARSEDLFERYGPAASDPSWRP